MDELTQEFYQLKLSLSPLLVFIDEIKNIRRSRHISEESSITTLGLLTLDIKEDIITTVRSLQIEEEQRIAELNEIIRDTQKEMRDKFYDYSQSVTNLEMDLQNLGDLISRQGSFLEGQNKVFDNLKKDMHEKATIKDILEVKKSLKHYTPVADFDTLSNQVAECSTKSSLEMVRKDLHNLEKRVKSYITLNELNDSISSSNELMRKFLVDNFLSIHSFDEEKKFNEKRFDRLDDEIKVLFQKNEILNDQLKKKFKEIFDIIKKKPWEPDTALLQSQIYECSTKKEFEDLKSSVNPKIDSFHRSVTESITNIQMFGKILERYDEILLDKASKDDVSLINSKLPSFTPLSTFKELSSNFNKNTDLQAEKNKANSLKTEEIQQHINGIMQKIEIIRRENLEVTAIASTLTSISEKINEKADKSDIYLIYDIMGRKEEMNLMKDFEILVKKQLETTVIILHSLCRTMLKSGESPAVTRKQRYDLYRNLTNLIGWINGEEQKEYKENNISLSSKSPVNLKTEYDIEMYNELLTSARVMKRTRRNVMTTSPRNKTLTDFVSLPPII